MRAPIIKTRRGCTACAVTALAVMIGGCGTILYVAAKGLLADMERRHEESKAAVPYSTALCASGVAKTQVFNDARMEIDGEGRLVKVYSGVLTCSDGTKKRFLYKDQNGRL